MRTRQKLSADPSSLILGIVALVIIVPGCCCGLLDILALILCIIGLVMAEKSLKEYDRNREYFDVRSRSNVRSGKIICIIGLVISSLIIMIYTFYFIAYGAIFSDIIKDRYTNTNSYSHVQDTIENYQDFDYHDSIPTDSTATDTTTLAEPIK